jgi:hypothetical protein
MVTEAEQSTSLFPGHNDPLGQSCAKNAILFLEVADHASELAIGSLGQQDKQRGIEVADGDHRSKWRQTLACEFGYQLRALAAALEYNPQAHATSGVAVFLAPSHG